MTRPVCLHGHYALGAALGADLWMVVAVTASAVCLRAGERFAQVDRVTFDRHWRPVVIP
jgi:4-diphosphocytidyl-2C-methyl-D-erythritol kinase